MTYESILNKLLSAYRSPGMARPSLIEAFHELHEATQQARLIFETEEGLKVNTHIRFPLSVIEAQLEQIAEILERDFNQKAK